MKARHCRNLLILLTLLAAGLRIYGAWANRVVLHADSSVVALMARHMAEGRELPVFFYGQHYMGSLEPMVSALLVRLFGDHGFVVCLGPALVSMFAYLVFIRWIWRTLGPGAAVWGGVIMVMGPVEYFMFQFAPRGGYMIALWIGIWLVAEGAKRSVALFQGEPVAWPVFLRLGLVVGVGMWCHMIVAASVVTAALLLLFGMRGRVWRYLPQITGGVIGVLVGFSPWITYNLHTHGASLGFLEEAASSTAGEALDLLDDRWEQLHAVPQDFLLREVGIWVLPVAALLGWGQLLLRQLRRPVWEEKTAALTGAGLAFLVSVVLFVSSDFAFRDTGRYLIPVVPFVVYAALTFFTEGGHVRGRILPAVLIVLILWTQAPALLRLQKFNREAPYHRKGQQWVRGLLQEAEEHHVYAHLLYYHFNYELDEEFRFVDARHPFYSRFAREVEFADSVAFYQAYLGLPEFLRLTGSEARRVERFGKTLYQETRFPPRFDDLVPRNDFREVRIQGTPTANLNDFRADTGWAGEGIQGEARLDLVLPETSTASHLLLEFAPQRDDRIPHLPYGFQVWTREDANGDWQLLHPEQGMTRFFWSGPRLYPIGRRERICFRLPDPQIREVNVVFRPDGAGAHPDWRLLEIVALEPPPMETVPDSWDLEAVYQAITDLEIRKVFADRWPSNQIYQHWQGKVQVELIPHVDADGGLPRDGRLRVCGHTAVLVRSEDLEPTAAVLHLLGLRHEPHALGDWTLITFPGLGEEPLEVDAYWNGMFVRQGLPVF